MTDGRNKKSNNKPRRPGINIGIGKERDYFIENLSMLINSGLPISDALQSIKTEMRTRRMRNVLDDIIEEIDSGSPIWRALQNTGAFPEYTVSLVRIGEKSGNLAENLKVIALQEEKARILKDRIRSAMLYPVLVLTLTIVIGAGIAWFILPRLSTVFNQLQLELPTISKGFIATGVFLGDYGAVVVPSFFVLLIGMVYFTFYFSRTKFIGQALLFSFSGTRKLIQEVEIARFGYLLGTLLEAGMTVTQALDSLTTATLFRNYRNFYTFLRQSIIEGNSFQKSFKNYDKSKKLIPTPIQQMIITSERSGNLATTLLKISRNYEVKTETTTKNLTVVLEPILLVIVWVGVVTVALAVILPIYNLIGRFNEGGSSTSSTPPPTSVQSNVTLPTLEITTIDTEYIDVRLEPLPASEIIGRAYQGVSYEFSNEDGGWYELILSENNKGWINGQYISIIP